MMDTQDYLKLTDRIDTTPCAKVETQSVPNHIKSHAGLHIKMVRDQATQQQCDLLIKKIYNKKGFIPESRSQQGKNASNQIVSFIAQDKTGETVGTISLIYDASTELPCWSTFAEECINPNAAGHRQAEVVRFAILPTSENPKQILTLLFNLMYIHARYIHGCDELLVEVNPRHTAFYRRQLGFTSTGSIRPCPRVGGQPATLMRLDLSVAEKKIRYFAGNKSVIKGTKERSLYPRFLQTTIEKRIITQLRNSISIQRP